MLAWIFLLLAVRSFILALQEEKTSALRTLDVALGTLSLLLFFALPSNFLLLPFVIIAAILGFSLYLRLSKPLSEKKPTLQKMIGWASLYAVGAFVALSSTFFTMMQDKKIAKVIITGNSHPEWVNWKNPANQKIEGAWLQSYEVIVQDLKGKEICRPFVYGDFVALRAEVMTIEWPLHLLGFSNLCHLEILYNGYTTSARHNLLPHAGIALPFPLPAFQMVWDKLYHSDWKIPGIKRASLESAYLPLAAAGSYWLIVGSSGLSSVAVEAIPVKK